MTAPTKLISADNPQFFNSFKNPEKIPTEINFQNFLEALYIVLLFLVLKISEFRKGGAGG